MAITNRALAFASRWFDEATVRRTFEPLIADWQREWLDASPSHRASVGLLGFAAFMCAVIVSSPSVLLTRAPRTVTDRVAVRMMRFIAVTALLLLLPPTMQMLDGSGRWWLLLWLLPSTITFVFPLSMITAVDGIRRTAPLAPNVERALVLKLALVALLFMLSFGSVVVPAANQAFRVAQTEGGAPVIRGVRELTTWQLVNDPTMAAPQEPYTGGADRATRIQRELNNRATLVLMPMLVLWLRWIAIDRGGGKWWSPLPAPLVAVLVMAAFTLTSFAGFQLEHEFNWPPGAGHWLPIAAFTAWVVAANYWRRAIAPLPTPSA